MHAKQTIPDISLYHSRINDSIQSEVFREHNMNGTHFNLLLKPLMTFAFVATFHWLMNDINDRTSGEKLLPLLSNS